MMWTYSRVAQTTAGFTGADLENLMNEAAILSAKGEPPFHPPGGYRPGLCKGRDRSGEEEQGDL